MCIILIYITAKATQLKAVQPEFAHGSVCFWPVNFLKLKLTSSFRHSNILYKISHSHNALINSWNLLVPTVSGKSRLWVRLELT